LLYPFRKLSPKVLIFAGALVLAVLIPKSILEAYDLRAERGAAVKADALAASGTMLTDEQKAAQEMWAERLKDMKPDSAKIQKEIDERRSDYWTIFSAFVPVNVSLQSKTIYQWDFWDITGMMLLGMGLIKLGVFSAKRSRRFYALMAVIGYGIGLFGKLERIQLLGVVVAIWIFQLIVSPIWLRHFRFGPLEWAWRSLTYRQKQPMRVKTVDAEGVLSIYATT
jgi:uncharacterized membrane protein YeiB